jgi:hypothetical protein
MIERDDRAKDRPDALIDRETALDDRLLHMTREEARAYLDEYLRARGLSETGSTENAADT